MATNFVDTSDFLGRALLVQGISRVRSQCQNALRLTIHFQKNKNRGGDVTKVLYPLDSNRDAAIVVFDDAKDRETTLLHQHVFCDVCLQVQRLPPLFRSVEIDPIYATLLPDVVHSLMSSYWPVTNPSLGRQNTYKLSFSCTNELRCVEEEVYNNIARQSETPHFSSAATGCSYPDQVELTERKGMKYEDEVVLGGKRNKYQLGDGDPQVFISQPTTERDDSVALAAGDKKIEGNETSATDVQVKGTQDQTSKNDDDDGFSTQKENSIVLDMISYDFVRKFEKEAVEKILKKCNVKITRQITNLSVRVMFAEKGKTSAEGIQKIVDEFTALHQTTYGRLSRKTVECPQSISADVLENAASETSRVFKRTLITMAKVDGNHIQYVILSSNDAEEVAQHFRKLAGIQSKKKLRTVTPGPAPENMETESEYKINRPIATNQSMNTNGSESIDKWHSFLFSNDATAPNASQQSLEESPRGDFLTNEGMRIFIQRGDITKQQVEAIVSPSNSTLDYRNTGAAAWAIQNAAGYKLHSYCTDIMRSRKFNPMAVSECAISPGFDLRCSHIIHAVCPASYSLPRFKIKLQNTFYNCLLLAREKIIKTLAIPLIGSGSTGAPKKDCADVLARVILNFSSESKGIFKEVHLVNIDNEATEAIKMSFKEMFQAGNTYQSNPVATGRNDLPDAARYSHQTDDRRKDSDQLPEKQHTLKVKDDTKHLGAKQMVEGVGKGESQKSNTHSKASPMTETTHDKSNECAICLSDKMIDEEVLPCKHSFCKKCINIHLEKDYRCPTCRAVCGKPKGNQPKCEMTDWRELRSVHLSGKGESQKSNTHSKVSPMTETTHDKSNECAICLSDKMIDEEVLPCKHSFCKKCIKTHLEKYYKCPVCRAVCGKPKGNQPKGKMTDGRDRSAHLSGYEKDGVITIRYDIPSGVQTEDHPNPGKHFTGATRTAYLPDNKEGREVLYLLRKAFNARLVFTVGRSVTTGAENTVTWNTIQHKTSHFGGPSNFGYPDPDYLKRVKEDLAALGIK